MKPDFSDQQLLRIQECLALRVDQLEKKRAQVDSEIEDEVHELRGIANSISLHLHSQRMKK